MFSLPTVRNRLETHIKIKSVNPDFDHDESEEYGGEQEYGWFMVKKLEEMGFGVQTQNIKEEYDKVKNDRFNVLAEKGEGDTVVGFYGHLDTVSPSRDWSGDPFEPWVEDGQMYALGAYDMKAGNLAILESVKNIPDTVTVKVAFGVDEEFESKGSTELVKKDWFSDADIVFVPEISDKCSHRGVELGRRGRISIAVTVYGESAHAANPEQGESAIKNAVELIRELDRLDVGEDAEMGTATLTIRSFESDAGSASIPEEASMILDRHMVTGETVDGCLEQVREAANRADVRLLDRPTPYLEPYKTSPNTPIVSQFLNVVEKTHGEPSLMYGKPTADENRIAEIGIPVVSYGPIGGNEHAANEWVDLESVCGLVQTYNQFLDSL